MAIEPLIYATGPALVDFFSPELSINTLTKWVGGGKVRTNEKGLRCFQDVAIALIGTISRDRDRFKSLKTDGDLKEEVERARLRKLLLEADIIEIDRDERRGQLISVEEAIAEIEDGFTRVKTKLMALPDRLALEISGLNDPAEIRGILEDTVREALQELHTTITEDDGQTTETD